MDAARPQVVSSKGKTWGAFSEADLAAHRAALLDPASSKELLLNTLRKLDCYRICVRGPACLQRTAGW